MAEEQDLSGISEEELNKQLVNLIGTTPSGDEKFSVHRFLHSVATAKDTTKLGNLSVIELGNTELTQRAYKELSLISNKIMNNGFFKEYFETEAEIVTSTSLSKDAKLIELSVIQKREITDKTKRQVKENKSWF